MSTRCPFGAGRRDVNISGVCGSIVSSARNESTAKSVISLRIVAMQRRSPIREAQTRMRTDPSLGTTIGLWNTAFSIVTRAGPGNTAAACCAIASNAITAGSTRWP